MPGGGIARGGMRQPFSFSKPCKRSARSPRARRRSYELGASAPSSHATRTGGILAGVLTSSSPPAGGSPIHDVPAEQRPASLTIGGALGNDAGTALRGRTDFSCAALFAGAPALASSSYRCAKFGDARPADAIPRSAATKPEGARKARESPKGRGAPATPYYDLLRSSILL